MHLRNFSTESQISFFSFLLANRISVRLWKTLNNWLVWHNFPTFESFNGLSKDHHPSMINIPNETGGQTGTENMPFLVFAWKPNENLKFYCIVLLSSSHSSIAILISSRTFPKALLIFKRAGQKERTQKLLSDSTNPPLPHLGIWTNYFLPSELKRIYVVIRSQIIMNSITAPKKHSPIIQL